MTDDPGRRRLVQEATPTFLRCVACGRGRRVVRHGRLVVCDDQDVAGVCHLAAGSRLGMMTQVTSGLPYRSDFGLVSYGEVE
jgi:hypothetical protein